MYLNVSRDEQKRRFLDRLEREDKHWKLSVDDMRERRLWKQYDEAFEDAINATATKESPWYVLPADDKWFTRIIRRLIRRKPRKFRQFWQSWRMANNQHKVYFLWISREKYGSTHFGVCKPG